MKSYSSIYYKHADPEIMNKIDFLFQTHFGHADTFKEVADHINQKEGINLAESLITQVKNIEFDLSPITIYRVMGYSVCHFVHEPTDKELIDLILKFLKHLVPDIEIFAWKKPPDVSDNYWLRFNNNQLIQYR